MKKYFFICLLLLVACSSAKKKDVGESKEKINNKSLEKVISDSTANYVKETVIVKHASSKIISEVVTMTPMDPSMPSTVTDSSGNVMTLKNVIYKIERLITLNKTALKEAVNEKNEAVIKKEKTLSKQSNKKNSAKSLELTVKRRSIWSIFTLTVTLLVIAAVLMYIRYGNKLVPMFFNFFKINKNGNT